MGCGRPFRTTPLVNDGGLRLYQADCLQVLRELADDSIDSVVTDPPYGINFMGKAWDGAQIARDAQQEREAEDQRRREGRGAFRLTGDLDTPERREWIERTGTAFGGAAAAAGSYDFSLGAFGDERDWTTLGEPAARDHTKSRERSGSMHAGSYDLTPRGQRGFQAWCEAWGTELLRVLKPGGYALVFGGTRTYHRLACGLEDAGFEIRDSLMWLFGQGFPKSRNVGVETGHESRTALGTALKPGYEPIVCARKPLEGTVIANVLEHGTGAMRIDDCRIPIDDVAAYRANHSGDRGHAGTRPIEGRGATDIRTGGGSAAEARWPANVALDEEAAALLDAQTGELASGANPTRRNGSKFGDVYGEFAGGEETPARGADRGGASRFFYCAKVSRSERNAGLEGFDEQALRWSDGDQNPGSFQSEGTHKAARNHHPTVKPIALMRWLARLVTPPGGVILDPFTGSGTTGCAAALEGFRFVGIEREPDYVSIAHARIVHWRKASPQLELEVA